MRRGSCITPCGWPKGKSLPPRGSSPKRSLRRSSSPRWSPLARATGRPLPMFETTDTSRRYLSGDVIYGRCDLARGVLRGLLATGWGWLGSSGPCREGELSRLPPALAHEAFMRPDVQWAGALPRNAAQSFGLASMLNFVNAEERRETGCVTTIANCALQPSNTASLCPGAICRERGFGESGWRRTIWI